MRGNRKCREADHDIIPSGNPRLPPFGVCTISKDSEPFFLFDIANALEHTEFSVRLRVPSSVCFGFA